MNSLDSYLSLLFEDEGMSEPSPNVPLKPLSKMKVVPGAKVYRVFRADVYMLAKYEGGRGQPFFHGYIGVLDFGGVKVKGVIVGFAEPRVKMVMPGDNVRLVMKLGKPLAIRRGMRFHIYGGKKIVGVGSVTDLIS